MSKCECCKEENSDLITYKGYKMCPTCYMGYVRKVKVCENNAKYETEIDQLKQQLAEKDKEIAHLKEKDNYHLRYELAGADETITNLKQQLAEKDKELLKQKEKSARTEQIYNGMIVDKDKEIEKLKQQYTILESENGKLTTELIMGKYKKAQKEVSFGKQLAIQELEKVKDWLNEPFDEDGCFKIGGDLIDFIEQQIKELKGEK